jgi:translocation and assembly module TamB
LAVKVLTRRNLMTLVLLAAAGLSAAAASSYLLFLGWGPAVAPVRRAVERTLERRMGLSVSWGELRPAPFGVLVLEGLTARERSGREVVTAEQAAIHLSLWSWLAQRGRLTALVGRVELVRPRLWVVREADGQWNLARHLRPAEPGAALWQGELSLSDGEVDVRGWHPSELAAPAGAPAAGSGFRLTAVSGTVSVGPGGRTRVELAARTDLLPGARLSAAGGFGGGAPSQIDLALSRVELGPVQQFLPSADRFGEFRKGRGDLRGSFRFDGSGGSKMRLVSARAAVYGAEWRHPALRAPFREVSGQFALAAETLQITDLSFAFLATRWTAQGRVTNLDNPELEARLSGENASLPTLAEAWPTPWPGATLAGRATLDLAVRGKWRNPLVSGFLRLSGVSVTVPGNRFPVSDLNGTVEFAGDGLWSRHLTARVAGGQVSVRGELRDWQKPHGSLHLALEGVPVEGVRRLAPAGVAASLRPLTGGRVSGSLELAGALAHPAVRGRLGLLGARWADLPLESAEVEGAYAEGRINLQRVAIAAAGGRLETSVTLSGLEGEEPRYEFGGQVSGMDAAALVDAAGLRLPVVVGGRVSALLAGSGEGRTWEKLTASGTLSLTEGRIGEERLTSVQAGFTVGRGELALDYFTAFSPDGRLSGYGRRAADGRLSGTLSGREIKLAAIARHVRGLPLDGTADLLAEVGGTGEEPELSGEISLTSPSFRQQAFTDGRGRLRITRRQVLLEDLTVHRGEGVLEADGTIGLGPGYPLDVTLTVGTLPARTVLALAGVEADLSGRADGVFALRGPASTARVAGQVELTGGKIAGFPYAKAAARFAYYGEILEFERLEVEGEGVAVTGRGRLVGQELDLEVAADRLDLARLPLPGQTEGAWRGTSSFRGALRGSLRHPVWEGEVKGTGVAYRTYGVDAFAGFLRYQDGKLALSRVELERGGGRYVVTGEVEPQRARLDLRLRFDQAEVEDLLKLVSVRSPYRIGGKTTGLLHVWGSFPTPGARLIAKADEVQVEELRLTGDVDLALRDGEVTVNRLQLREAGGEGLLVAVGRVGRTLELEARARRMDLGPLVALLGVARGTPGAVPAGAPLEIAGRVDAELVVQGTPAEPRASLAGTVAEARINETALSNVRGRATYADGAVNLEELVLAGGEQRLTATGTWPVPPARLAALGVKAPERIWDLQVAMARGDLGILSFFSPALRLSGPGSLALRLTGPAGAPQVAGEIVAEGVTVSHPALGGDVSGVRGRLELGPEGLRTKQLTGAYQGGEVQLGGQVALAGLSVQGLDLTLSGRGVSYRSAPFEALLDADLTVRGPLAEAVIAGQATLRKSTLTLGEWGAPLEVAWNPKLDLTVTSREDMRVMTADRSVDVRAYGTLALRGRLESPAFTGEAEASRGSIVYLNTPFRVTRGQALFAAYRGILPTLDVTAETVVPLAVAPSPAGEPGGTGGSSQPPTSGGLPLGRETVTVQLKVTGPAESLSLRLSADPPLDQAEILAALGLPGGGGPTAAGSQPASSSENGLFRLAEQELSHRVFSGLEVAVAEALQLDQVSLAPRFREKNIQLHVGKYLVENIYLTYTRTMESDPWESIGLEYRIFHGLTFATSVDNRGELKWGFEARHRF